MVEGPTGPMCPDPRDMPELYLDYAVSEEASRALLPGVPLDTLLLLLLLPLLRLLVLPFAPLDDSPPRLMATTRLKITRAARPVEIKAMARVDMPFFPLSEGEPGGRRPISER